MHSLVAGAWLDAARRVARASRLPEALEVSAFLDANCIVGWPTAQGVTCHQKRKAEDLVIIPIIGNDAQTRAGVSLTQRYGGLSPAKYAAEPDVIILNGDCRLPAILMGVIFLHEGYHALWNRRRPELRTNAEEWMGWIHEKDSVNFHNSILGAVFGDPYAALLEKYIELMRAELAKLGVGPAEIIFVRRFSTKAELELLYGPAGTNLELWARNSFFLMHAHLELIARDWPEETERLQTTLVRRLGGKE